MNDELTDPLTSRLSRQLHDQVDGWHAAPLTLEGVQGRARSIRRRRQALTSGVVVAAAVLTLAVPVGIGLSSRPDSAPDVTDPSPTRVVGREPSALGVPYLEDRTLTLPNGAERELAERYDGAVVFGDRVLAVARDAESAGWALVRPDGGRLPLATGSLAVNSDASAVAYVRDDGHVLVESFDGTVADLGRYGTVEPVALVGGPDCSAPGSCAVWVTRSAGGFDVVQNGGPRLAVPPGVSVTDATVDGRLAVVTSVDLSAGGACSAVLDRGVTVAESCDYTYGRFSPDGEHLSAAPAYESGIGDVFAAVLDADGDEVARFEPGRSGFVWSSTWEDSGHLLVTTYDYEKGWRVVRLGTDGRKEVALGPSTRGDDVTPAYVVLGPTS